MGQRDDLIPEDFLHHLQKTVPGFKGEEVKHQMALARMSWNGSSKRRQHLHFDGHASFTHQELEADFGRGKFAEINGRVEFFSVTPNWSVDRSYTKGYLLSDLARQSRDAYLSTDWRKLTKLLSGDGTKLKSLPAAVASKDMGGMTTTAWRNAKALNKARVDLASLAALRRWLVQRRDDWRAGRAPVSLFSDIPSLERIEWLADTTAQIIRMAKTDVVGNGYVLHRYVQAKSGRLYAKGINLQTAPTIIKEAALAGLWEYDFANCHYAILAQMAAKFGYQCKAIEHYLAHKKATREAIAEQAGITFDQAKVCLLAVMYGARASEWHESAIPDAIGVEGARRLYQIEQFVEIKSDIQGARQAILKGWPRTANGRLTNAFGKAISTTAKSEERLAHLIQGVEAKALKTAIDLYPDSIVLLQHDGFAASARLDSKAIDCLLYTSPSPRDRTRSRMPSSA